MAIRIECTIDGLDDNWLQLSDTWSRREMRAWYTAVLQADESTWLPILQSKLLGVHMRLIDGTPIADADVLIEQLDNMDVRLTRWLPHSVLGALMEMLALSESSRRILLDGAAVPAASPKTAPTRTL